MLLKILMEEKQLNFNRPLLSVRRIPSKVSTEKDDKKMTGKSLPSIPPRPSYKSELKSSPVRKPGTVPFVWEQSPGKPKDENHIQPCNPIIPQPPPGRILKATPSVPEKVHEKEASSSVEEYAMQNGYGEEYTMQNWYGEAAYVDARDTLTRTDLFFLTCTLSGLKGPKVEPSRTFSADHGNRDFAIGSFLPVCRTQREVSKLAGVATDETRSAHGPRKMESCGYRDTAMNKSNQVRYGSDSQNLVGSSLYRRLQGSGVSVPKNELPQSRSCEEKRYLDQNTEMQKGFGSRRKVVSPKLNSFYSDGKGIYNSTSNDLEIVGKVKGLEETSVDSSLEEIDNAKVRLDEKVEFRSKRWNPADSSVPSSSCKSDQKEGMETVKGTGQDQCISQTSNISVSSELSNNVCLDFEDKQQLTKVGNVENCQGIDSRLPVPPPLPKPPSESWLSRTLPELYSRNSSSG
ncbi:hypothetical protein Vadar_026848 [Vaccinium darrowii]|uniref:Uncharacterized protein n=1 Tax=Vaccinium darrowii TaxID=229202 RepID=A0ACB7XUM8_9ERIC|nr:hypothetical protein Vadar_026848 [Vaccinium darrowii]